MCSCHPQPVHEAVEILPDSGEAESWLSRRPASSDAPALEGGPRRSVDGRGRPGHEGLGPEPRPGRRRGAPRRRAAPPRTPRPASGSHAARPGTCPGRRRRGPRGRPRPGRGRARPAAGPRPTRSCSPNSRRPSTRSRSGSSRRPEVDLGLGGVGRRGLGGTVGVEQRDDLGPGGRPEGRRTAATRTSSPPSSPMAMRRPSRVAGRLAQPVAVPHRAHELGVAVAGRHPAAARGTSTRPGCRRRAGRRCAGSRPGPGEVSSPKMPSTRPVSKPRADRRRCRSATSSPRSMGRRR